MLNFSYIRTELRLLLKVCGLGLELRVGCWGLKLGLKPHGLELGDQWTQTWYTATTIKQWYALTVVSRLSVSCLSSVSWAESFISRSCTDISCALSSFSLDFFTDFDDLSDSLVNSRCLCHTTTRTSASITPSQLSHMTDFFGNRIVNIRHNLPPGTTDSTSFSKTSHLGTTIFYCTVN